MESEQSLLLESLLAEAGFTMTAIDDRQGLLGEDAARIVWARTYPSATELVDGWRDEETWLVNYVGDRVSAEKSWELYLVLASDVAAAKEAPELEAIRSDTSYTRKLVIPSLVTATPARVRNLLASLRPLELNVRVDVPDPLTLLESAAETDGRPDVRETLRRYRENRPLFGGLP